MTKGELLRNGLTMNYSMLINKALVILNREKGAHDKGPLSLGEKEKETLSKAKILVDKLRVWHEFVENKEIRAEEMDYISEGMALSDIISNAYPKEIFLGSNFFENISKSLWLLMGNYLIYDIQLEESYMFFEKFQEELSAINNAEKYGVSIL